MQRKGFVISALLVIFVSTALFSMQDSYSFSIDELLEKYNASKGKEKWYFGKDFQPSTYTYDVCDSLLHVPGTFDQCYQAELRFLDYLRSESKFFWIVQAKITHEEQEKYMIFQIDAKSFDITTSAIFTDYASSIERTVFWPIQLANDFNRQDLEIGSSWGIVSSHSVNDDAEMIVQSTNTHSTESGYLTDVYHIGFLQTVDSFIEIAEHHPLPINAEFYKPHYAMQRVPLLFSFELVDYTGNVVGVISGEDSAVIIEQDESGEINQSVEYFEDFVSDEELAEYAVENLDEFTDSVQIEEFLEESDYMLDEENSLTIEIPENIAEIDNVFDFIFQFENHYDLKVQEYIDELKENEDIDAEDIENLQDFLEILELNRQNPNQTSTNSTSP